MCNQENQEILSNKLKLICSEILECIQDTGTVILASEIGACTIKSQFGIYSSTLVNPDGFTHVVSHDNKDYLDLYIRTLVVLGFRRYYV